MENDRADNVTAVLAEAGRGNADAAERLAGIVYDELHRLAHSILHGQGANHTLCTTALVNEAWLKIAGKGHRETTYQSRSHFFRTAARAMRSILIDYARQRQRIKRGGDWRRSPLDDVIETIEVHRVDLIALDEALKRLHEISPRRSHVVELRFFSGLSIAEVSSILNISHGTVENDWSFARAWLHRQIEGGAGPGRGSGGAGQ